MALQQPRGFLFIVAVQLAFLYHAICQAPPTPPGTWTTLPPLTTTFKAPSACWTPESGLSLGIQNAGFPGSWFFVNCTTYEPECCPPGYPSNVTGPVIEPLYAPGFCPEGHEPKIYSIAGGNGERVRYCCPLYLTLENYGTEPFCVSTVSDTSSNPGTTNERPASSSYRPVLIAKPIFIINSGDMAPSPNLTQEQASPTPGDFRPGHWNSNGLKVGITLAVSIPVIAVLAFVCRVFVFVPRRARQPRDGGETAGAGAVAVPAYALEEMTRRRASQCGDGDSILTEPPPPYLGREAAPPRASGEEANRTEGISRQDEVESSQPRGQEQQIEGESGGIEPTR